jgi:hypothetical protein
MQLVFKFSIHFWKTIPGPTFCMDFVLSIDFLVTLAVRSLKNCALWSHSGKEEQDSAWNQKFWSDISERISNVTEILAPKPREPQQNLWKCEFHSKLARKNNFQVWRSTRCCKSPYKRVYSRIKRSSNGSPRIFPLTLLEQGWCREKTSAFVMHLEWRTSWNTCDQLDTKSSESPARNCNRAIGFFSPFADLLYSKYFWVWRMHAFKSLEKQLSRVT